MNRISWNQYFMSQSHLLSRRSTCTRLAVGATIVREKRMIAGGYNGSIAGGAHCSDEGCYVIDNHCVRTIHAEMNALLQCAKFGVPTEGAEIYVTHFPCLQCCKALIQSGIKTVYYAVDYKNHPYAVELFNQAKVNIVQVQLEKSQDDETKQEFMTSLIDKLAETKMNNEEIQALYKKAELLFS